MFGVFLAKPLPCSSSPCLNGGACRDNGDKYSCRCTPRYTGVKCEKKISEYIQWYNNDTIQFNFVLFLFKRKGQTV